MLLAAVQLSICIEALFNSPRPPLVAVSAVISFVSCACLFPLLSLEHARSIRPSDLAVIYLLVSLVADAESLWKRTLTSAVGSLTLTGHILAAVSILAKLCLLVAESRSKERILHVSEEGRSPEQLAGILNRTFFWWINSILAQGYAGILDENSLPSLDRDLGSWRLRRRALTAWDQRGTWPAGAILTSDIFQKLLTIVK